MAYLSVNSKGFLKLAFGQVDGSSVEKVALLILVRQFVSVRKTVMVTLQCFGEFAVDVFETQVPHVEAGYDG